MSDYLHFMGIARHSAFSNALWLKVDIRKAHIAERYNLLLKDPERPTIELAGSVAQGLLLKSFSAPIEERIPFQIRIWTGLICVVLIERGINPRHIEYASGALVQDEAYLGFGAEAYFEALAAYDDVDAPAERIA